MCLCLGPFKSGKTLLMKSLQGDEIDDATYTVPTNGINLFTVKNDTGEFDMVIKEIGGSMAPIWKHYFDKVLVSQNNCITIISRMIQFSNCYDTSFTYYC